MQASAHGQGGSGEYILFSVTHHNSYFSFDHSAFRSPILCQALRGEMMNQIQILVSGTTYLPYLGLHTQLFGSV